LDHIFSILRPVEIVWGQILASMRAFVGTGKVRNLLFAIAEPVMMPACLDVSIHTFTLKPTLELLDLGAVGREDRLQAWNIGGIQRPVLLTILLTQIRARVKDVNTYIRLGTLTLLVINRLVGVFVQNSIILCHPFFLVARSDILHIFQISKRVPGRLRGRPARHDYSKKDTCQKASPVHGAPPFKEW
jgi:hypothetical protein